MIYNRLRKLKYLLQYYLGYKQMALKGYNRVFVPETLSGGAESPTLPRSQPICQN